ncbi:MAG: DUF2188 domain-containing protein [Methanobrevibacter sp.]|jgi:hypothetical protein|nr:DUF2188 domain-containing protein [Candidatus Methanoflexus mossambicus]
MENTNVYIVPLKDGWGVGRPFANKLSGKFSNKQEATEYGISLAKKDKSVLTILKKNGFIEKRIYGKDPCPPKDRK